MRQLVLFLYSFSSVVLIGYLLIAGQDLLIPLVIAIVVWFLLNTLINAIRNIEWYGYSPPYPLALLVALGCTAFICWILFNIISVNVAEVIKRLPLYQTKLKALSEQGFDFLGIQERPNLTELFQSLDLMSLATGIAQAMTTIAGNAGIIFLYVLFILLEQYSFDLKLAKLIQDPAKLTTVRDLIGRISTQIQSYIKIKIFVSLITAVCCYFVMRAVGVDFSGFWALLIFLFHFIPTIGSIIATVFPTVLTLIQFESFTPFLIILITLTSIQFFIGNIVEPKLLGRSVNLSGLVIILSLAIWAKIWGVTGMFLCVPIMVIANIILANFPATRPVAILLSEKGDVR